MSVNQVDQAVAVHDRVAAFFRRFDTAFATFDGADIAARYAEPYLACQADGSADSYPRTIDIANYFQPSAIERGCTKAHLETFSYQARPFYERHGYTVFATLDQYPESHQRHFMRKTL